MSSQDDLTQFLNAASQGDKAYIEKLFPMVYQELRRVAANQMRQERSNHTLQPTALVHEAFLKLAGQNTPWENRNHFFCIASRLMRRILVDHARAKNADKRGSGQTLLALDETPAQSGVTEPKDIDLLVLEEALLKLEALDPALSQLVELRFFAGLGIEETATALGKSPATVKRDWAKARAWLFREIEGKDAE